MFKLNTGRSMLIALVLALTALAPAGTALAQDNPSKGAVRGVLQDARQALGDEAPSVAHPILDQAVSAGTITQAEANALLAQVSAGTLPTVPAGASDALRAVVQQVRDAICAQLSSVVRPLLSQAVSAGTITQAQADRLLERLRAACTTQPQQQTPAQGEQPTKQGRGHGGGCKKGGPRG